MDRTMDIPYSNPLIIGHRGFKAKFPENTMAGFRAAISAGVEMIELDVQLTKDGHLVVIHDDELDRTTNGKGPVISRTLAELTKLDAGAWFDPRFNNEHIPTLEAVLDLAKGRVLVNIEIKVAPEDRLEQLRDIDKIVLEMIFRKRLEKQVLVSSFNKYVLESIHRSCHTPALGVLTEFGEELDIIKVCKSLDAFSWHPYFLDLDKDKVSRMHRHGIKVIPYTVNSPEDMAPLKKMGVDGIFTDDPVDAQTFNSP